MRDETNHGASIPDTTQPVYADFPVQYDSTMGDTPNVPTILLSALPVGVALDAKGQEVPVLGVLVVVSDDAKRRLEAESVKESMTEAVNQCEALLQEFPRMMEQTYGSAVLQLAMLRVAAASGLIPNPMK